MRHGDCSQVFLVGLVLASVQALSALPNFVVVFTDDQTGDAIGYDSPQKLNTPHLDRLAASGLIFEHAYVASPVCAASRASVMTSLYPQQHGVIATNGKRFARFHSGGPEAGATLPNRLNGLGYHTAAFGKSHLGDPKAYGFLEGQETSGKDHGDVKLFSLVSEFVTSSRAKEKPFFLWVAPRQPHLPLLPTDKWLDLYETDRIELPKNFRESPLPESINNQGLPREQFYRDSDYTRNWKGLTAGPPRGERHMRAFIHAYYAVISHLDFQIGRLVDELQYEGLWENTVFIFLSDNGYHLGSHGLGNKITMHEESVRVPMFATGPGIAKGKRTTALVSALDVYPTILELAGSESLPAGVMGKSLVPLFENSQATIRDVVFSEGAGVNAGPGEGHRMARSKRFKYVLTDTNEAYFFDEQIDSLEQRNLMDAALLQGQRIELRSQLKEWMESIGDRPFPGNG